MRSRHTQRIVTAAVIVAAVLAFQYWEVSVMIVGLGMVGYAVKNLIC